MAKKLKNQHTPSPFENPDRKPWGENIWGDRFPLIGLVVILVTVAIIWYADSRGVIDWQEQTRQDPWKTENPYDKSSAEEDSIQ